MSERAAYLLCLVLLAGLVLFLPARWTSALRLWPLAVLGPMDDAVGGKGAPGAAAPPGESMEGLRNERDELRVKLAEQQALILDLELKLKGRVELTSIGIPDSFRVISANVLFSRDASQWRRSMLLGCGTADGLADDLLVVAGMRVVGRVVEAGERTSRVLLLTDPRFRIGAVAVPPDLPKDGQIPREEGVLQGTSEEEATMTLRHLSRTTKVQPGWFVLTSPDPGRHWPGGLLIGTVKSVSSDYGHFLRIEVTPAVDVSTLDSVMVLKP